MMDLDDEIPCDELEDDEIPWHELEDDEIPSHELEDDEFRGTNEKTTTLETSFNRTKGGATPTTGTCVANLESMRVNPRPLRSASL